MDNPDSSTSMGNPQQSANEKQEEAIPPKTSKETADESGEQTSPEEGSAAGAPNAAKSTDDADDVKTNVDENAGSKSEGPGEGTENSPEETISGPVPEEKDGAPESSEDPDVPASKDGEAAASSTESGTPNKQTVTHAKSGSDPPAAETAPETEAKNEKTETELSQPTVKEEGKEGGEESAAMEVEESTEAKEPEAQPAPESPKLKAENSAKSNDNNSSNTNYNSNTTTYSTRGRSTEAAEEKQDRIHERDSFEESPRPKDPSAAFSFLVEGTEEERRTRTRFIPEVDGMHMLRKHEVKSDLALARSLPSIVSPSGVFQSRTGRLAASAGRSNDSMDVDGEEMNLAVNDENTTTIELPSSNLTIPSDVFVAPKGVVVGESGSSIAVKEFEPRVPSPSVVESVTKFNPPRPPESVGGKKKHRMIRWERRPEDIEVDMKNYRKTVQRTRQELQKSEGEYERLEMVDAHLRRHFLNQSDLLDEEYEKLNDEMDREVEKLIKESELIGSRTRSRNLTKVDVVMRDVLTMLTRNEQKDVPMGEAASVDSFSSGRFAGFGGLNAAAFNDWDRSTKLKSMKLSSSWLEPGQKVKTLYGEGTVIEVIPPVCPPSNDKAVIPIHGSKKSVLSEEKLNRIKAKKKYDSVLPLRVKIQLDYGIGVFSASSILDIESPGHFTDAKLAKRWKGMIDSALKVGHCIDVEGMLLNEDTKSDAPDGVSSDEFLPVGATLIPTKGGRGNFLQNMDILDIEEPLKTALYDGHGVMGRKSNPGVTKDIRKWEEEEQEYLNLRASILQLKNTLTRQRRIRILNEKTANSMNDRYVRAEELVSEMRSDLKSLKRRLRDELSELGITDTIAKQIMFQFYQGHHEEDHGDASTPKRLRRASSMIGEMLPDIDMGNNSGEGDTRDSMDEQGTDDLSGDDLETHRPTKKIRSGE
ncbi:unnamed protein product [Pseudo-nitzschia multistriata]|uniref:Uncharacterized protein n=1 Tax=Pseudo-nitzschia multistriata TaxID=183589 RepID=A0A448Z6P7_9STRA|nr:unnamed protein product [Pseudo-nitzschia multistriata]